MEQNRFHTSRNGSGAGLNQALSFLGGIFLGMLAGRRKGRKTALSPEIPPAPALEPAPARPISNPQAMAASLQKAHQPSEVSFPLLVTVGVLTLLSAFVIHSILWWWLKDLKGPASVDEATAWKVIRQPSATAPPQYPELQIAPKQDLQEFLAKQQRENQQFGWVDRTSGIARIPIEAAMQLVADRGVPNWESPGQETGHVSPLELQHGRVPQKQEDAK